MIEKLYRAPSYGNGSLFGFMQLRCADAIRCKLVKIALRFVSVLSVLLTLGLMPWTSVQAVGNAATGASYLTAVAPGNNLCGACHGTPQINNTAAFSTYGTTANQLSVYGNPTTGAAAIATAATGGYAIPASNIVDNAATDFNTVTNMSVQAGTLGTPGLPSQTAQDIQAYFASLFPTPAITSGTTANAQVGTTYANFYTNHRKQLACQLQHQCRNIARRD